MTWEWSKLWKWGCLGVYNVGSPRWHEKPGRQRGTQQGLLFPPDVQWHEMVCPLTGHFPETALWELLPRRVLDQSPRWCLEPRDPSWDPSLRSLWCGSASHRRVDRWAKPNTAFPKVSPSASSKPMTGQEFQSQKALIRTLKREEQVDVCECPLCYRLAWCF